MLKTATLAAAVLILAAPHGHADERSIVSGKVKQLSELPPDSGVVPSWVEVVVGASGRDVHLFIPFMTAGQKLPKTGAACQFKVSVKDIDGFVGSKISKKKSAFVADEFSCQASLVP